jgi:hypothetical protein
LTSIKAPGASAPDMTSLMAARVDTVRPELTVNPDTAFTLAQWDEARLSARDIGRARTPRYVAQIPRVSDDLGEALSQMGFSLEDYIDAH